MTLDEFFTELEKTKEVIKWEGEFLIRGTIENNRFCPLTAVYWGKTQSFLPMMLGRNAGKNLGLSSTDIRNIMDAADFDFSLQRPETEIVRQKLVQTLGVGHQ